MVTLATVSKVAGVSTATVSRVLNQPHKVDRNTRQVVEKAIEKLGYRPNQYARGLASKTSKTIGVIVNRFSSTYYGFMLDGVEEALVEYGYKTLAESSRETAEGENQALLSLIDRQCDALVIHTNKLTDIELAQYQNKARPIVFMNRKVQACENESIYLDNKSAGQLAASYLLQKGHTSFAMVTGPKSYHESVSRTNGFISTLKEHAITIDKDCIIESDFTVQGGYDSLCRLLKQQKHFTAIFFHNDEMAAGAYKACREHGIAIPSQISILGFDDAVIASHLTPGLTTIEQPLAEIGRASGLLALSLLKNKPEIFQGSKLFTATVKERDSVKDINRE